MVEVKRLKNTSFDIFPMPMVPPVYMINIRAAAISCTFNLLFLKLTVGLCIFCFYLLFSVEMVKINVSCLQKYNKK